MTPSLPASPLDPMPQAVFLDVPFLLEASLPRQRTGWFWYGLGGLLLGVLASGYISMHSAAANAGMTLISGLVMCGMMIGVSTVSWQAVRRARLEQAQLESIEELVQL